MSYRSTNKLVSLSVGLGLAFAVLACNKKDAAPPCPAKFSQLKDYKAAGEKSCACAKDSAKGSVWGNGIYTTDSSICAAAVHAGAIKKSGGTVTYKYTKGCESYEGSEKNGVRTNKWGAYEGSFYFPSKGDGTCAIQK